LAAIPASFHIDSSEAAAALFAPTFSHNGVEELRIAHVDEQRRLIALRFHKSGTADALELPLQEIAREALVLRSHGILMAHSHPSGDPTPSRADIEATRSLGELAARLGIFLYDHLIFAGDGWRSLQVLGLL
jgi:DNA repair protein RadC